MIAPPLLARLADGGAVSARSTPLSRAADDALTAREVCVGTALARGLSIRAAAALLLGPETVDFHLQQTYAKLRIRSCAQLAVVAVEAGWVRRAADARTQMVRREE